MNHFKFNKLTLHNFLSYGHAQVLLGDRGQCLVSGTNLCQDDKAQSNGSGKSSIWSGINWVLTGRTLAGVANDVKNINVEQNACWVSLDFFVNSQHFEITRWKMPKADLKIFLNGNDISGKGIRESEAVLQQYLPYLEGELLGSVILLGQSMPNKLSSRQPRQRKELLEKLSKTDFMVEQVKQRILQRQNQLAKTVRDLQDRQLKLRATIEAKTQSRASAQRRLATLMQQNYTVQMQTLQADISLLTEQQVAFQATLMELSEKLQSAQQQKDGCLAERQQRLATVSAQLAEAKAKWSAARATLTAQINQLKRQITKIQAIKTVCPTCGQKLPQVHKPSCDVEKATLAQKQQQLSCVMRQQSDQLAQLSNAAQCITDQFATRLQSTSAAYNTVKKQHDEAAIANTKLTTALVSKKTTQQALIRMQAGAVQQQQSLQTQLKALQHQLLTHVKQSQTITVQLAELNQHTNVLKQFQSLVKRDFRGILLENVIAFIDSSIKGYCKEVFNTTDLNFYVQGNNINITYRSKPYEVLSGGEKQKVDILIQLAIRKMLSKYLDFSSNILVLDEVFDNLDAQGTAGVLSLITNKLVDIQSVFIISHHANQLNINYDSEIRVLKDANGISKLA